MCLQHCSSVDFIISFACNGSNTVSGNNEELKTVMLQYRSRGDWITVNSSK